MNQSTKTLQQIMILLLGCMVLLLFASCEKTSYTTIVKAVKGTKFALYYEEPVDETNLLHLRAYNNDPSPAIDVFLDLDYLGHFSSTPDTMVLHLDEFGLEKGRHYIYLTQSDQILSYFTVDYGSDQEITIDIIPTLGFSFEDDSTAILNKFGTPDKTLITDEDCYFYYNNYLSSDFQLQIHLISGTVYNYLLTHNEYTNSRYHNMIQQSLETQYHLFVKQSAFTFFIDAESYQQATLLIRLDNSNNVITYYSITNNPYF